jgi:hypothetical protein
MSNDISDPEERAGYKTITYPYQGNGGFTRAINEAISLISIPLVTNLMALQMKDTK